MRRAKLTRTKVPVRVPSRSGSAEKSAASTTVNSGTKSGSARSRRDEEMTREETMPRKLGVDSQRHAIAFVGTDIAIETVGFPFGEIGGDAIPERVEARRFDRLVRIVPVDVLLAGRLPHEEFVFRRATRMRSCIDDELARRPEYPLTASNGMLDQRGTREVLPELNDLQFIRKGKNAVPPLPTDGFESCFPALGGRACRRSEPTASNAEPMRWMLLFPSFAAVMLGVVLAGDAALPFHFGLFAPGPLDAITDVPGVRVSNLTKIEGSDVRTGATAVLPNADPWNHKVSAAFFAFNGNGELTGTHWIEEAGYLEEPVVLTDTLDVGRAADGVVSWVIDHHPAVGRGDDVPLPVVAECDDGFLNDIQARAVTASDVVRLLDAAAPGDFARGSVGAGTGDERVRLSRRHRLRLARASGRRRRLSRGRPG